MYQPSKILLKPSKGVVTDISAEDVQPGFAIESINGRFLPTRDGKSFQWVGVRGSLPIPITGTGWLGTYRIVAMEQFQKTIIAFVKTTNTSETLIVQLVPVFGTTKPITSFVATVLVSDPNNLYLKLNTSNPISKIRIVYETGTIFTIYWNDRVSAIKSIRIINGSGSDTLANVNFSQSLKYGNIVFNGIVSGSLMGGAMFYAYRLLGKNGAATDWSMAMGPIMVPNKMASTGRSWEDYLSIRYARSDERSACGISLTIENIDPSFHKVQLATIVSNENSTFERAYICAEEKILSATSITLSHLSDISYGDIIVTDIQISTQALLGCADFDIVNNIMVVISPKIDEALTRNELTDQITYNKVLGATITAKRQKLQFDNNSSADQNPLYTASCIGALTSSVQSVLVSKFKNRLTGLSENRTITVPNEYVGYKNPIVATLMKNCWRGETYRLAMVPVNNYGKRLGARFIGDFTVPKRHEESRSGDIDLSSSDCVRLVDEDTDKYLMNVISLMVGNIDISQWVHVDNSGTATSCDIQGFHIVVSPRDKKVLHEGALFVSANHVRSDETTEMSDYGVILGNRWDVTPSDNSIKSKPIKNLYQYYSPDVQNNLLVSPEGGSLLQIEEQHKGQFESSMPNGLLVWPTGYTAHGVFLPFPGAIDSYTPWHYTNGWSDQNSQYKGIRIWNKYFKYLESSDTWEWALARNAVLAQQNEIDGYYNLPAFNAAMEHASQAIYIEQLGQKKFINAYWGWIRQTSPSELDHDAFGSGAACRLIITKTIEDSGYNINPFATCFTNGLTVVSSRRNSSELYGGTSDSALEKSTYRSCWHYQPIDNTILTKIKTVDGKFIFDSVEVFAGDSFIVPYSVDRLSHGTNLGTADFPIPDPGADFYPTNSFMVPLQSNINWTMGDGDRWEKHRGLRAAITDENSHDTVTGIGVLKIPDTPAYGRLEHSDYPTLANVIYGQNIYYALPESIFYTDSYPMRIFWSNRKIDAEEVDGFRIFPFENYQSIQGDFGLPITIRSSMDNAIIFTTDCVGVVPIDERSAVSDESGKQLSIGRSSGVGKFTVIDRVHGLQHFFSLSQKGEDFTWFDFKNRDWIFWGKGQGLTNLSQKYKFSSDFLSIFSDPLLFDELQTAIRTAFGNDGEILLYKSGSRAYVFDILNNIYQGRRDITIGESLLVASIPVTSNLGALSIPGYGDYSKVDGSYVEVSLTMVANDNPFSRKIFDSFICSCENVAQIICTAKNGTVSTINILKIINDLGSLYRFNIIDQDNDGEYIGEMPLTDIYDYLRGFYATVKIVGFQDPNILGLTEPVSLNSLILNVRNDI